MEDLCPLRAFKRGSSEAGRVQYGAAVCVVAGNAFQARCGRPCSCRSKLPNECFAKFSASWVGAHPLIPLLPQWSIKLHSGSSEALQQYRANLTAMAAHLERLAEHAEVYWVLQGESASFQVVLREALRSKPTSLALAVSLARSPQIQ